jgi:YD repeat-containing protein
MRKRGKLARNVTRGGGSTTVRNHGSPIPRGASREPSPLRSTGVCEYDGAGNIRKKGTTTYRYDAFQRLSGWTDGMLIRARRGPVHQPPRLPRPARGQRHRVVDPGPHVAKDGRFR